MAKKKKTKKTTSKKEKSVLEEFQELLAEAPLDFMGTGDRASEKQAEKYFYELVDKFESRLSQLMREHAELQARGYDSQQGGLPLEAGGYRRGG